LRFPQPIEPSVIMAVATTEEPAVGLPTLQPLWHEKAPRDLVERCPASDPVAGWKAWQDHLRERRKPITPPFIQQKQSPILWGWPTAWQHDSIKKSLESPTTLAELAIDDDATSAPDLPASLQLVALAYALPRLARELPAETWWFLVERLHATATQAHSQQFDGTTDPHGVLRNQLLAGELPLALGYLFPEVRALRELRHEARTTLSESLIELTDGQGLPHARLLPVFAPLFACWTRCRCLGEHLRRGAWSDTADVQYDWLVRNAIRLADADGRFLLSPTSTPNAGQWSDSLFETALELVGDRGDHAAAVAALPSGIVDQPHKLKRKDLPQPSLNSDWAAITVMANGWTQCAARVAIAYTRDPLAFELSVDGEPLFAGDWTFNTICNSQPVHATGEWEQLCWETGKRFDLLELGLTLSAGLRLERQILFGREDRVLYLADIILSDDGLPRRLQHSTVLPLASTAQWNAESDTRDGVIHANKVRAAVMPLALREWRADPRSGSLTAVDNRLVLSQEANGRAICCPIFIDLESKRSKKERTWRQLTIGENMEIMAPDVAAGFRAQSGDDQWLVYRSLGPAGNRTLLGHNVAGEFCAGSFIDGKFKEWIEIEAV
jgi:hypothetical protein